MQVYVTSSLSKNLNIGFSSGFLSESFQTVHDDDFHVAQLLLIYFWSL